MNVTIVGNWGAYPEVDSATASFLIEHNEYNILVDCGSGVFSSLQRYLSPEKLKALIISHYHKDHVSDVGCLQYFFQIQSELENNNAPFPIYGHNKDLDSFNNLTYKNYTIGNAISPNKAVRIGPFRVSFCSTIHPVYNLAMRFEVDNKVIVYTGDTEWCEPLIKFSKEADILISEANLYNDSLGKISGHLTAGQAGLLASYAKVKELILIHLPHHGNHELLISQAKKNYNGPVNIAKSGQSIKSY